MENGLLEITSLHPQKESLQKVNQDLYIVQILRTTDMPPLHRVPEELRVGVGRK